MFRGSFAATGVPEAVGRMEWPQFTAADQSIVDLDLEVRLLTTQKLCDCQFWMDVVKAEMWIRPCIVSGDCGIGYCMNGPTKTAPYHCHP